MAVYLCRGCHLEFNRLQDYLIHRENNWEKCFKEKTPQEAYNKVNSPINQKETKMITCGHCDKPFDNYDQYSNHLEMRQCLKKETKMTREEAVKKCHGINYPHAFIQSLEALGLIKFEEKKEDNLHIIIQKARNYHNNDIDGVKALIKQIEDAGYRVVKLGRRYRLYSADCSIEHTTINTISMTVDNIQEQS